MKDKNPKTEFRRPKEGRNPKSEPDHTQPLELQLQIATFNLNFSEPQP